MEREPMVHEVVMVHTPGTLETLVCPDCGARTYEVVRRRNLMAVFCAGCRAVLAQGRHG